MKFKEQPLQTFRLRNFKAVRDSGAIKFAPLTVFIGNNGSGKSSLIEGLETFQSIVVDGLDEAMNRWRGFENICNKAVPHVPYYPADQRPCLTNPIRWEIRSGHSPDENVAADAFYRAEIEVNASPSYDEIFIQAEKIRFRVQDVGIHYRDSYGRRKFDSLDGNLAVFDETPWSFVPTGKSVFRDTVDYGIGDWQFLSLDSDRMGEPQPQNRSSQTTRLRKDGTNIGDYLRNILNSKSGREVLDGIIETLRYVLPYAVDVQPAITSELQRTVYLQLSEADFKIPGWLLSTGTLRVLALLAVLRHPTPPPLLLIEEIENGLDPRTLNLIVEEIRYATQSGRTQVVVTTHSPYLLDLLHLSQIIVVERDETGQPIFFRPDEKQLGDWAREFAPGQLYTMSQLQRPAKGDGK